MLSKLLLFSVCIYGTIGYEEPWGKDADLHYPTPSTPQASTSIPVWLAEQLIRFHQQVLSPVDGPRSHFHPSSSQYMALAMQKYGFLKGFYLGCDRLLRENDDAWVYRNIEVDNRILKHNPVP